MGLMKKTKAQLVEIILRKDDEELCLKKQIKENEKVIDMKDKAITEMKKSLEIANLNVEQHQEGMDELTSQKVAAEETAKKFEEERNNARGWNYILSALVVIMVTLLITL